MGVVRLLVAAAVAFFLIGSVVVGFGQFGLSRRGDYSLDRGTVTLSHMVAAPRARVVYLVVVGIFAALLLTADTMCCLGWNQAPRRPPAWYYPTRLAMTFVALALLFATVLFDVHRYRTAHLSLFLGFCVCVFAYACVEAARGAPRSLRIFHTTLAALLLLVMVFALVGRHVARYEPSICIGELLVFPIVAVLVASAHASDDP